MAEIRELPDGGTRKAVLLNLATALTVLYLLSFICSVIGWLTPEIIASYGVTFDRWWMGIGGTALTWVGSENMKKHSTAVMNR